MKKWLHYGLLSVAAFCFLAGIVVILVGYLRYLNVYESYQLKICQIINTSSLPNGDMIRLEAVRSTQPRFTKWFTVDSLADYPLLSEVACYVREQLINHTLRIDDIQIEAYSDFLSLLIGLILLFLCLMASLIFIIIGVVERRNRHQRYQIDEVPGDFRYQDDYDRYNVDAEVGLNSVLQSFEEAQRQLWRNQSRLRENIFDTLKREQVIAVLGEHSTRIKFQKDVYAALKSLEVVV